MKSAHLMQTETTLSAVVQEQAVRASQSQERIPIAVAYGDGIGPEIMDAVMRVLDAAKAP